MLGPIAALCIWSILAERAYRKTLSESERRRHDAQCDEDIANW
ncbi:hypothetical protein [Bradyrhizobium cosmicum]|nr:hypothetical protein [Bradyrhizobium cosmicum]